jgi:hypothetical protein
MKMLSAVLILAASTCAAQSVEEKHKMRNFEGKAYWVSSVDFVGLNYAYVRQGVDYRFDRRGPLAFTAKADEGFVHTYLGTERAVPYRGMARHYTSGVFGYAMSRVL